jgi:hypothetical protein
VGLGGERRGKRDKKERQESVERTVSEPGIREDNCVYFIKPVLTPLPAPFYLRTAPKAGLLPA